MLRKQIAVVFTSLSLSLVALFGCGKQETSPMDGKWSYIHDTESVALKIKGDSAVLDGKKYDFSWDEEKLYLKDKKGNITELRYETEGDEAMFLYKPATYQFQGEGTPDGVVGLWLDTTNGMSSFEFTNEGTFCEDKYIPGYYLVNEEEGSILLVYNDHYADTIIYYSIEDDILKVDYPWPMVRYGK